MLDHSDVLVTVLLVLAKDEDPVVAKKAVSVGTAFYCSILEEMAMQVRIVSQVGCVVLRICGFKSLSIIVFSDYQREYTYL